MSLLAVLNAFSGFVMLLVELQEGRLACNGSYFSNLTFFFHIGTLLTSLAICVLLAVASERVRYSIQNEKLLVHIVHYLTADNTVLLV